MVNIFERSKIERDTLLYHATNKDHANSIALSGIAPYRNAWGGGELGHGFYTHRSVQSAKNYANHLESKDMAILVFGVNKPIVGRVIPSNYYFGESVDNEWYEYSTNFLTKSEDRGEVKLNYPSSDAVSLLGVIYRDKFYSKDSWKSTQMISDLRKVETYRRTSIQMFRERVERLQQKLKKSNQILRVGETLNQQLRNILQAKDGVYKFLNDTIERHNHSLFHMLDRDTLLPKREALHYFNPLSLKTEELLQKKGKFLDNFSDSIPAIRLDGEIHSADLLEDLRKVTDKISLFKEYLSMEKEDLRLRLNQLSKRVFLTLEPHSLSVKSDMLEQNRRLMLDLTNVQERLRKVNQRLGDCERFVELGEDYRKFVSENFMTFDTREEVRKDWLRNSIELRNQEIERRLEREQVFGSMLRSENTLRRDSRQAVMGF